VSSAPRSLVDGVPGDLVSIRDRGMQYGDGLFETMRCEHGRLRWFERHLARLTLGCERLGLAAPDGALLRAEAQFLAGSAPRALVKVMLTRGVATARGYRPAGDERGTRIVSAHDWPAAGSEEFRVGLSDVGLGINPAIAGIKHLNRLEQVLAQRAAGQLGLHEVLMATAAGEVVCGSMSNLFVWRDDVLLTPPVDQCGVAGVMRSLVFDAAARLGLAVRVEPLPAAALASARAMFVTNIRLGVQPVHWYEGRRLAVDGRGERLQELIDGPLA
jgi:4-amino-4-deoxychorismate lyase